MFVGDVRCATTTSPLAPIWMLSGGRKQSSAPTNASKYVHVLPAMARRYDASADDSAAARPAVGRLSAYAIHGAAIQSRRIGAAADHASRRVPATTTRMASASTGLAIMRV